MSVVEEEEADVVAVRIEAGRRVKSQLIGCSISLHLTCLFYTQCFCRGQLKSRAMATRKGA
ncbi:hypothetical protein E2C01_037024 [Portunus trituberculatus]|uniref:Uncharacterized protein n=1 Tax=Portunus trituberculatus TaxID=210409 RepID=A0A5B7F722_PORTR|nr:hypothetical protein [Portunus trituberculatus]